MMFSSCVGKMRELKLSTNEVVFSSEASSYVVTSDVELYICGFEGDEISSYENGNYYTGSWLRVTNNGTSILIEVKENSSDESRSAKVELQERLHSNRIASIDVIQQGQD